MSKRLSSLERLYTAGSTLQAQTFVGYWKMKTGVYTTELEASMCQTGSGHQHQIISSFRFLNFTRLHLRTRTGKDGNHTINWDIVHL